MALIEIPNAVEAREQVSKDRDIRFIDTWNEAASLINEAIKRNKTEVRVPFNRKVFAILREKHYGVNANLDDRPGDSKEMLVSW